MRLVDVHCHLNHRLFQKDLSKVLERAQKAGLVRILCAGTGPASNREVLEISKKYPGLVGCTFGAYPLEAINYISNEPDESGITRHGSFDLDAELEWMRDNRDSCVGIGEAGLDYAEVADAGLIKRMKENFQKIIRFCEKIKKPLVIHSRKAEADCVQMIESSRLKNVVFHCFHGRKSLLKRVNDGGWCCSIPPVIMRLQHFETVVQELNISQLLTETDAPWLGPVAGERNEPANVARAIRRIAELKSLTEEETANNIFMNCRAVFG